MTVATVTGFIPPAPRPHSAYLFPSRPVEDRVPRHWKENVMSTGLVPLDETGTMTLAPRALWAVEQQWTKAARKTVCLVMTP